MKNSPMKFEEVYAGEMKYISARRALIDAEDAEEPAQSLFGIALSGGGIRAATISLGFLEILRNCGILARADYLSTVSGGGYCGGYIHTKLQREQNFQSLFEQNDIDHLLDYGYYLAPPQRLFKNVQVQHKDPNQTLKWDQKLMRQVNNLRLAGAFVASLLMNWVWVILFALSVVGLFAVIADAISVTGVTWFLHMMLETAAVVLGVHFSLHYLRHLRLWSSDVLNYIEGALIVLIAVPFVVLASGHASVCGLDSTDFFVISVAALVYTGFFGNPNILTMHRFYRDRLASAFLDAGTEKGGGLYLHELCTSAISGKPSVAPYALINTCLNLVGGDDLTFAGTKRSDYFVLSPHYVGSETTGYMRTDDSMYRKLTLGTAVAVSGAALNPGMGTGTNKALAFFMTLLNLQLGYWAVNPGYTGRFRLPIPWWPYYQILQLLSKTDSTRSRVNISDGGHVENLGVYELLRRRCNLIIAIDAGADPKYEFNDLRNLIVRARNELGLSITFEEGQRPEERIRPSASSGFSRSQFSIAKIEVLPRENGVRDGYKGLLVYVKASLRAPGTWRHFARNQPEYWSFQYKTYHPRFPHETTADQFFDPDQWQAYHYLGMYMAGDLLGIDLRNEEAVADGLKKLQKKRINELIPFFSSRK